MKKKLSAHANHAYAGLQSADWHLCIHTEHKTSHGGGLAIMLGKKPDVKSSCSIIWNDFFKKFYCTYPNIFILSGCILLKGLQ